MREAMERPEKWAIGLDAKPPAGGGRGLPVSGARKGFLEPSPPRSPADIPVRIKIENALKTGGRPERKLTSIPQVIRKGS
jgi:hypothetical protein